jgi:ribonucleoside-triphosphate reductase
LDAEYSDWLCIPKSVRMTSIKPSGTVSLLNGSTPGIHYPEDEYYIRRIRFAADSDMLPALEEAGYKIEPDHYSPNTMCVEFPCS